MTHMHCPLVQTRSLFIKSINPGSLTHIIVKRKDLPGSNQSPAGSLALISTLPYLNANESDVRNRALRTGFKICGIEPIRSQPLYDGLVHLSGKYKYY